jgi:hypothetical protein
MAPRLDVGQYVDNGGFQCFPIVRRLEAVRYELTWKKI